MWWWEWRGADGMWVYAHSTQQELLIKALEEQRRQLKEHEGSNKKVERKIEKELKWTLKLDPKAADKEARRAGFEVEERATEKEAKPVVKKEKEEAPAAAAAASSSAAAPAEA